MKSFSAFTVFPNFIDLLYTVTEEKPGSIPKRIWVKKYPETEKKTPKPLGDTFQKSTNISLLLFPSWATLSAASRASKWLQTSTVIKAFLSFIPWLSHPGGFH